MGFSGPSFPMKCFDNFLHFGTLHQEPYPLQYPLTEWGRMGLEIKKPHYLQKREWLHCNDFVLNSTIDRLYEKL